MDEDKLLGRDYITSQDWSNEEIEYVLRFAEELKRKFINGEPHRYLQDKTLFMIFFDPSTRTRNSFEAGMTQLGGHAHDLTMEKIWISHGESIKDTANVLSRYGHGIAIRCCKFGEGHRYIREMAKYANVPVFNMQCDLYHPCQALADLMTLKEKLRKLEGKKIAVTWAFSPRYDKPLSVAHSLIMLLPRFGMDVVIAHPPEYKLREEIIKTAMENANKSGAKLEIHNNMKDAFESADVVYPKSWGCMMTTTERNIMKKIAEKYKEWKCTLELMDIANKDAIYMHCLPADRGYEVEDDVIDSQKSVVYEQAENKLHVQKSLMALTMGRRK